MLIIYILLPQPSHAQCDVEVTGVITYCNSFLGSGGSETIIDGYFVGFRAISFTGDTLDVVDIDGTVPTNLGKRIDDINTESEPDDTTRVQLMIAGGMDTIEYWYFGPYPDGSSFNIALVDPNGDCDTVFVASGTFDCADFTPYTDPGACGDEVPLFFLDFEHSVFDIGGGEGVNENIDEIFLVMTRTRETMCCDLEPPGSTCFQFIVRLSPENIGLVIDDVGSGSTGGKIYADSIVNFECLGDADSTWPFQQDNGQSSDIGPLCLTSGVQDWIVLTCKPGGNETNASIDAISAPFSPPQVTIEPCNVMLEVIDADSAFWSSMDDPMLLNFDTCSPNGLVCSFLYNIDVFGDVTECEGDTFYYIAGGIPAASECFTLDTVIFDTTYVVVYPIFNVDIDLECNASNDSVILTANVTSLAVGCDYQYAWSTGDTTASITVLPDGAEYSVTVTRGDLPPGADMCVTAIDTAAAVSVFTVDCSAVNDSLLFCIEDVPEPDTALVFIDGCSVGLIYSVDVSNGGAGCIEDTLFITRHYIVDFDADTILTTDDRDTCTQIFTVVDSTPPSITCPDDISIACTDPNTPDNTGFATATDNCAGIPDVDFSDAVNPGGCAAGISRTWTATDACGNTSTCVQLIFVDDFDSPSITCPSDMTIQCGTSSDPISTGTATATDNCDLDPDITYSDDTAPGACILTPVILRTWTATDACGNSSTCLQAITIVDSAAPEVACPPFITIDCNEDSSPANTGTPTVVDNCDPAPMVDYFDTLQPGSCPGEGTILRVWVVADLCGNTSTCQQVITIEDNTPPSISCPPDTLVDCDADLLPQALGLAAATDDCAAAVTDITNSDAIVDGSCADEYTILRTWTAVDSCGNPSTCIQTISVQDTTAPIINCPPDATVSCDGSLSPDVLGVASAVDNCSGKLPGDQVTFSDNTPSADCADGLVIVRTWVATDNCGNSSSCTQLITVSDDAPPAFECPDDGTVGCSADNEPPFTTLEEFLAAGGSASDDCALDSMSFTLLSETIVGDGCGTILRVYSVADACGSTSSCTHTLTIVDNLPPLLSFPPDMIPLCCPELVTVFPDLDAFVNTGGSASDNCGLDSSSFALLSELTMSSDCNDHVIQTYVVSDLCGNTATAEVHYIIDRDPSEAVLVCNDAVNISLGPECIAFITPELLLLTFEGCAQDFEVNALPPYELLPGDIVDASFIGLTIAVMVTDPLSGNSCWTWVTIEDKLAPVLFCAADTIACDASIDPLDLGLPIADGYIITQNPDGSYTVDLEACGPVQFEYYDEIIYHGCNSDFDQTIYRHWTATDVAGNSGGCTDTIYILRASLDAIILPPHYDGIDNPGLECGGPCILPDGSPDTDCTGSPSGATCRNILITFEDQRINTCGGSYKIHRIWRIVDICTYEVRYYIQRILVADTEPPLIECLDTIFANTSGFQCLASLVAPVPAITDVCSDFDYTIFVSAGTVNEIKGQFIISQLPPGDHILRYVATDACFNQSICETLIHVSDESVPVAICDQHTVVALSSTKIVTTVPAIDFSDGSYDACGDITILGRRMDSCIDFDWTTTGDDEEPNGLLNGFDFGTEFNEEVPFACCDIGAGPIMIELLVIDESGNTSRCMVEVTVQDKAAPEIVCPPDITLPCGFDIDSASLYDIDDRTFGTVLNGLIFDDSDREPVIVDGINWGIDGIAFDNCNLALSLQVLDLRDMCGQGVIYRTFTATDPATGSASCTQVITVEITDPFDEWDIIWPADVEVDGPCNVDPGDTGEPFLFDTECDLTAFQYEDLVLTLTDGVCAKILRTWYVLDWCQYNQETGEGLWTREQVIKILNSGDPEFGIAKSKDAICDTDPGVVMTSACHANVSFEQLVSDDCTAPELLRSQYAIDLYADGSIEFSSALQTGEGPNATIQGSSLLLDATVSNVPYNNPEDNEEHHLIIWTALDGCGNEGEYAQQFRLEDCKAPSPVCQNIIAPLMPNGTLEVWAVDFNASSSDNCTRAEDLRYSFSSVEIIPSLNFDCTDIEDNGSLVFEVPVWVWDAWGNTAQCIATLTIQDPNEICGTSNNLVISGHIETTGAIPVELVVTGLKGGMQSEMITAEDGYYHFDHVPAMKQYEITPFRNDDHKNGVSTLDLILIQKHLLGQQPFDEPYDYIAADANNSESVTALDLIELRKLILGLYDALPNNTSWRFIDANTTFEEPENPYDVPGAITVDATHTDITDVDFTGIKIGDLNGSVQANATQIVTRSGAKQWSLQATDHFVHKGEEVTIEFTTNNSNELLGMQGFFAFAGLEEVHMSEGSLNISDENIAASADGLAFSWHRIESSNDADSKVLFAVKGIAQRDGLISEMISLNARVLSPELYTEEAGMIQTYSLGLIFTHEKRSEGLPFALYQNIPNPWQHETVIRFDLPYAMECKLNVYDAVGILRKSYSIKGVSGSNYVTIEEKPFSGADVLYYHLAAEEFSAVKKMWRK